jgi:hypothetical protein
MDATGEGVTELNINLASSGGPSGRYLDKVAGELFKSVGVHEQNKMRDR